MFVEAGVPGDLVRVTSIERRGRMARGRIGELVEPSPDRVEPACADFGTCGGCAWQHIDYAAQVEAKRRIVFDALTRIGGFALTEPPEAVPSPSAYAYRARTRCFETASGLGYRRRGTHEGLAPVACPILLPEVDAARRAWRPLEDARESGGSVRASKRRRVPDAEWEVLTDGAASPRTRVTPVSKGRAPNPEGATLEIRVRGEVFDASPGSFVQGNALLWDALVEAVVAEATVADSAGAKPGRFVELYAGIGFFTVPLARAGLGGLAGESAGPAVRDLRANLRRAGLAERVEVRAGRVEGRRDWPGAFAVADVLVLDPPRVGVESGLREVIATSGPRRCVYVSCDPATLARDLRVLAEGGYRLQSVRAFDLFPQTPHVETIARLER